MKEKLVAAFIFIAPKAEPTKHRAVIDTPMVRLIAIGVKNYNEAVEEAKRLVREDNVSVIELCGGFGHIGAAKVAEAVNVPIGVVRFDVHPGLQCKSGDKVFL